MDMICLSIILGVIATIVMDIFSLLRSYIFRMTSFNYALLGRWFLTLKHGQLIHDSIILSQNKKHEKMIGWILHYLIGILLSYVYLITKLYFDNSNLFLIAIPFGLVTMLIPLLIMQPLLGFGFFASKTPNPIKSIQNSTFAHLSFGIGLYLADVISRDIF